ncbi:MAG TPA: hypothetical protein VEO18_05920 [Thermoplasmata archaeon]|nr:hypothetical protein [Thermoplasmata archaeon]
MPSPDEDMRRRQREAEAARDRAWDARAERHRVAVPRLDRAIEEANQRVGLAMLLLREGQSDSEVFDVIEATLREPGVPATDSTACMAESIVGCAAMRTGRGFPISDDDENDDE